MLTEVIPDVRPLLDHCCIWRWFITDVVERQQWVLERNTEAGGRTPRLPTCFRKRSDFTPALHVHTTM